MTRFTCKFFTTLVLLLGAMQQLQAQSGQYGNEWIDYSKQHFKFKVTSPGVYRISRSLLNAQGLPGTVAGSNFKMFRNGTEVPLYVSNEVMSGTDYIEFVGYGPDGLLDKKLYALAAWHPNEHISYFTDSAAYFLTYTAGGGNLRYTQVANTIPGVPPTAETYNWNTVTNSYKTAFLEGVSYDGFTGSSGTPQQGNPFFSPAFEQGEGLVRAQIGAAGTETISMATPNIASGAGVNASISTSIVTRSYDNSYNTGNTRTVNLSVNSNAITSGSVGTSVTRHLTASVPLAQLASTNNISYSITASKTPGLYDVYGVSYVMLKYPRNFDMTGLQSYHFSLNASGSAQYLVFSNFSGTARLYDITNRQFYEGDVNGSNTRFFINSSATERQFVLVDVNAGIKTPFFSKTMTFVNHSAAQADYLIVSHNKLNETTAGHNYLTEYRDYRASAAGGAHVAHLADVNELYDEFAYGYETHPLALTRYFEYAYNTWSLKPVYVNLVGRGLLYNEYSTYYANPSTLTFPIVPVFGHPGSDLNFVNFGTPHTQKIEIGRVAVWEPADVGKYLDKLKLYEAAIKGGTDEQSLWKKNVVHLVGGKSALEAANFGSVMDSRTSIITDTPYAAQVTTFVKGATAPSYADRLRLDSLINGGLSLITFYGHATPSAFEFSLPEPTTYNSNPRFPVFTALGCDVAAMFGAFTTRTLAERYTLAQTGGSIAMLATDNYGYTGTLDQYLTHFYNSITKLNYGATLGKHTLTANNLAYGDCCNSLTTSSSFGFTQIESQILTGDPAIAMFSPEKPDYQVSANTLSTTPQRLDITVDSFKLKIIANNIGRGVKDTLTITVEHESPGTPRTTIKTYKVLNLLYSDTMSFYVKIDKVRNRGLNNIYVKVDAVNKFSEMDETNNEAVLSRFIYSEDLIPVAPREFAIVGSSPVTLKASTMDPFIGGKNYHVEIDTTELFNSPLKLSQAVVSSGGIIKWTPSLTMVDGTVYYWRASMDSPVNGAVQWTNSSFIYLAGAGEGWNQSHYFQYRKDNFNSLALGTDRIFKYGGNTTNKLSISNIFFTSQFDGGNTVVEYNNNIVQPFNPANINSLVNCVQIMVIDSVTGLIQQNVPPMAGTVTGGTDGKNVFVFNTSSSSSRIAAARFIESVAPGNYIMIRNLSFNISSFVTTVYKDQWLADATVGVWAPDSSLYHSIRRLGFTYVDSIVSHTAFTFLGKKGDPAWSGTQQALTHTAATGKFAVEAEIVGNGNNGSLNSTVVGPYNSWTSLLWSQRSMDAVSANDSGYVTVYGIAPNNTETELYKGNLRTVPLNAYSAATYPKMRFVWTSRDTATTTPPQLDYWRVLGTPAPDLAINPSAHLLYTDTVYVGGSGARTANNSMSVSVAVENLNNTPTSTGVLVNYSMINAAGNTVSLGNQRYRTLTTQGDTLHAHYTFTPTSTVGTNTFMMMVNPDNDQSEAYMGNNFAAESFSVLNTSPLPLTLLSFTGTLRNKDAVLSWTTANEKDLSYFELERSFDGVIFSVVNKTSAYNTSGEHSYSYTDADWARKSNGYVYYRLKSVDLSTKYTRSQIVKFSTDKNELLIVNAYPNPTTNILNLEIQAPAADDYTLKVSDITGKQIMNIVYKMGAGLQQVKVPVNVLPAGVYMLSVSSAEGMPQQYKFVKQ